MGATPSRPGLGRSRLRQPLRAFSRCGGDGQTFLRCARGTAACRHGYRVRYDRRPRLLAESLVAPPEDRWFAWRRAVSLWARWLLDDGGFRARTPAESHDLFEILDDRSPPRATAIASPAPVAPWHALFPDATVGEAILDRLVHHAHQIPQQGESMRKVLPSPTGSAITEATEAPMSPSWCILFG